MCRDKFQFPIARNLFVKYTSKIFINKAYCTVKKMPPLPLQSHVTNRVRISYQFYLVQDQNKAQLPRFFKSFEDLDTRILWPSSFFSNTLRNMHI